MATINELYRKYLLSLSNRTPASLPANPLAPVPANPLGTYGGATMNELYQQYLLTQPGVGVSQNRYRDLMSQMGPATATMGTYSGTGLLPVSATPPPAFTSIPKIPAATTPAATTSKPVEVNPGGTSDFGSTSFLDNETEASRNDRMKSVDDLLGKVAKATIPGMGLLSAAQAAGVRANNVLAGLTVAQDAEAAARPANDFGVATQAEADAIDAAGGGSKSESDFGAATQAEADAIDAAGGGSKSQSDFGAATQAEADAIAEAAYYSNPTLSQKTPDEVQGLSRGMGLSFGVPSAYDFGFATQAEADAIDAAGRSGLSDPGETASNAADAAASQGVSDPGETASNAADAAAASAADAAAASDAASDAADAASDAASDASDSSSDSSSGDGGDGGDGGGDGGGGDGGGDGGGYAKGGKVIKAHLKGPNPKGPDEGYGGLLAGEFVIKKSAVKKYGEGLLGMINDGKIPVQKMKSLLV